MEDKVFSFVDLLETGDPIRVRARISMLKTEDGGRRGPFASGLRPNHNFGDSNNRSFYIGQIDVPEKTSVNPGETREVFITFLFGRGLAENLTPGRKWRIQEGPRVFAEAEVLEVMKS